MFEAQNPAEWVSHLERLQEGRHFLGEFRGYRDEFGWRSDAFELADRRLPWSAGIEGI
jgi:hypothetical protein